MMFPACRRGGSISLPMRSNKPRVLIVFNAGATVYGMERGVIETFDLLKPEVEPHFLMSYTTKRLDLPILREIKERGLSHSFLSDWTDWPRIGKPKSLREAWAMSLAITAKKNKQPRRPKLFWKSKDPRAVVLVRLTHPI